MKNLRIYNGFGITPTSSYTAAGLDFYCPDINTTAQIANAQIAFEKSYKVSIEEQIDILNVIKSCAILFYPNIPTNNLTDNWYNILHLFLALNSKELNDIDSTPARVAVFMAKYLVFNESTNKVGVRMRLNDHILINSGIKEALDPNSAGIYFNKSGKGTKGFDVRACVVDEDYAGYVHLSMAYTREDMGDGCVYAGEKVTQQVILPIIHMSPVEISEVTYNDLMANSARGDGAMGSTDNIKHTV